MYDDLKRTIPAELMVEIDGIGALQTGDRADVAQIIMSIETVLNGLDRAIAHAKQGIVKAIVRELEAPRLDTLKSLRLVRERCDATSCHPEEEAWPAVATPHSAAQRRRRCGMPTN